MGLLTFYLLGVLFAGLIITLIVRKELKADPHCTFTVAELLISVFISLFSWFLVIVAVGEGFRVLATKCSSSEKLANFLNKDLRK